jgi:HK97 family phage portal protein
MNLLQRIFKPKERRDFTQRDAEGWRDIIGPATGAGVQVTPRTALGIPAVLRAVTLLSGAVAALPLKVYRKTEDGREPATENQVYKLLHQAPNPLATPFIFKELIMNHLLLNGNFFAFIDWRHGKPTALWPLDPAAVTVDQDKVTGAVTYRVNTTRGQQELAPEEVLHVIGITLDGVKGISPITLARESIGGAIAELKHGQSFFKNGANLSGVLQHPGHLGPEAAETLRQSWRDKYSGSGNAGKVAVLEEGMEFKPVALSNKDSQWLESRQVSVLDVARIFGVPPALLGHLEKASYSSQDAQNLEFLTHSLRPWLSRIEQACNRSLMTHNNLYCEFTTGDLLRTTLDRRYEAYRTALAAGFMSVNEVRQLENLPAVDGGDELYRPLNMGLLGEEEPIDGEGNQSVTSDP